jgi:hypothetical protein
MCGLGASPRTTLRAERKCHSSAQLLAIFILVLTRDLGKIWIDMIAGSLAVTAPPHACQFGASHPFKHAQHALATSIPHLRWAARTQHGTRVSVFTYGRNLDHITVPVYACQRPTQSNLNSHLRKHL